MNSKVLEPPSELFENLEMLLRLNGRDWAEDRADAWLYGVIVGWTDDPFENTDGMETLRAIAAKHNWSDARIEQLQLLHRQWTEARNAQAPEVPDTAEKLEAALAVLEARAHEIQDKGRAAQCGTMRDVGKTEGYLEAVQVIRAAIAN